jgi:SpoVK/Ycf46/Vps4 family AAA+-type ATPase
MGILLYGPPGCGKTLMARAIAKEAGLRFLALPLSTVLDKWVGETEKYLDALFSLARKIQPCIIFIDEIDALTRRRSMLDRDWNVTMKSQFLSLWDGLLSGELNAKIVVIGATNRKTDIDEAFLRRMPLQIKISLPDWSQRVQILQLLLDKTAALHSDFDFGLIADQTEGWSGSDLKELCRRVELDHYYQDQDIEGTAGESLGEDAFSPKIAQMLREFADSYEHSEETILP